MLGVILYIGLSLLIGSLACFFGKKLYFPIMMLTIIFSCITTAICFLIMEFSSIPNLIGTEGIYSTMQT